MNKSLKQIALLNFFSLGLLGQFDNTLQLETGAGSPPASLESMAWVQGEWVGEGLGGLCEEVWSSARGGSMLGIFRLIKDEKLLFSEYMELVAVDGTISLRLKHFGNDFVGWEEKDRHVAFKLVKIDGDNIYFDGLTYRKTGENTMEVYVVLSSGDSSREAKFSYTRAEP